MVEDARELLLGETNRTMLNRALSAQVCQIALIAYNRRGTEGESGRSESGESYSFVDLPEKLQRIITNNRIAIVGGKRHEVKAK